jgi:molybdopterin synthase catalytic subunit
MNLKVGEDVMYIVVAGDIRENVISTLQDTLNTIKSTVTQKTQFFV